MSKTYTRRKFLNKSVKALVTIGLSSTLGYAYARFIEPNWIEVTQHTITHSLIPKNFDGVKIVQFSDTHIGHNFELNHLEHIINKINSLNPDIVLFTGDLLDHPNEYKQIDQVPPILRKIQATLGKFSIYGNHDHGGYGSDIYKDTMEKGHFNVLLNNSIEVAIKNEKIIIAGIDDIILGRPDFNETFKGIDENEYTVFLVHEPDVAPRAAAHGAMLQLSGHTHGGQIRLPFFGPLITPPLGNDYYEGNYYIGQSNMQLYVNRGLGTTRLPFRVLARPEISVFTLKSSAKIK
ncbi:metallophosphoesterase [Litchfieldia alkalitelluris]|uniref:metallophosphoesterase n=1 Tax=Litchfieldia alkalitelluris TaxID=304268 RepID=UPI0009970B96|nr:metallophosphoesterase [Litchfieldia alkalitelluris]